MTFFHHKTNQAKSAQPARTALLSILTLTLLLGGATVEARSRTFRSAKKASTLVGEQSLEWFAANPQTLTLYQYSNLPAETLIFESRMRLFTGSIFVRPVGNPEKVECLRNDTLLTPKTDIAEQVVFDIPIERYEDHRVVCRIKAPEKKHDPGDGPEPSAREIIRVTYRTAGLEDPRDQQNLVQHLNKIVSKYLTTEALTAPDFPSALSYAESTHVKDYFTTTMLGVHPSTKCSSATVSASQILMYLCDHDGSEDADIFFYSIPLKRNVKRQLVVNISPSDAYPILAKAADGSEYFAFNTSDDRLVAYSTSGELLFSKDLGGYGSRPIQVGSDLLIFTQTNSVPNYPAKNKVFLINERGEVSREWARQGEDLSEALLVGNQIWIGAPKGVIEIFSLEGETISVVDTNPVAVIPGGDITQLTLDLNQQVLAASSKGQLFRVSPETRDTSFLYFAPNQGFHSDYERNGRDRAPRSKPVVFQDGRIAFATDYRVHFLNADGKLERISLVGGFARIQAPLAILKFGPAASATEVLWVGGAGSVQAFTPTGVRRYIREIQDSENTSVPALISGPAGVQRYVVGMYGGLQAYDYHGQTHGKLMTEVSTEFWTEP